MKNRTIIKVTGMSKFPLDMLRHDHCWPRRASDGAFIQEQIIDPEAFNKKRPNWSERGVQLYVEAGHEVTVARWNSFGWSVDVVQFGEIVG